jgi:Arc/MetJ-type ribon-helix-helix transcriptional regulator
MAGRSLSVTVSMPLEMDETIAEEADKYDMAYSEYVRQALRESIGTPFDCEDQVLSVDESPQRGQNEGAA